MRRLLSRLRDERGAADDAVVVVIAAPALIALVLLCMAGMRVAIATQAVDQAAAQAARSASVARTGSQAGPSAEAAAAATLKNQGLRCLSSSVSVDTTGFSVPIGQPAQVSATVSCVVDLSDVAFPGLPGSLTLTRATSSPLDTYRERQP